MTSLSRRTFIVLEHQTVVVKIQSNDFISEMVKTKQQLLFFNKKLR